ALCPAGPGLRRRGLRPPLFCVAAPAPSALYTLSLHDALPILSGDVAPGALLAVVGPNGAGKSTLFRGIVGLLKPLAGTIAGLKRSEEHTSELQSRFDLVCRLLLEKKNEVQRACRAAAPYDGSR